jgi:hypothetical protein
MLGRRSRSTANDKGAEILADAADRLTQQGLDANGAVEAVVEAMRPRRWRRRMRRLLVVATVVGVGYVAVTKTPLRARISEMLFGPPLDEEEPEPITLPVTDAAADGGQEDSTDAEGEAEGEAREPAHRRRGGSRATSRHASDGNPV